MISPLKKVINRYKIIAPPVRNAIGVQFCIQAINSAMFLLLNYYMVKENFEDYEIADVLSYRFLAVFWLAFPIGLFIKGRRLVPFFFIAACTVPILSHLIILAIDYHWMPWLNYFAMAWGIAYMCIQVTILPFIILNAKPERHSEAISLSFLSFSVTICVVGIFNYLLHRFNPSFFDEKLLLQIVSTFSLLSVYFASKIKTSEKLSYKVPLVKILRDYDWSLILKAVAPTFIIAVGAGFTIPVINLFFLNVHGMTSEQFSIMGAATFFLVASVMVFMPSIRRSFGYRIAITFFQSMAVLALFLLASTEYYKDWTYAIYIAAFFYIIRQPLMNAAGPMTSELSMYFVGKRNQEIISALNASIWSGSWFVSMRIFGWLRQMEYRYVSIFLITVAMYIVGVIWYAWLIRQYEKQQRERRGVKQVEGVEKVEGVEGV